MTPNIYSLLCMEKYQNPDAFKVGDIVYRTDAYANKGYRSLYRITSKRKMFDCCISCRE